MFASLKNKIREETGNDLSKLTAKITSSTVQKIDSLRGRSFQGSHSSINSIISSEDFKEDGTIDLEELKRRLMKIEHEFARKLEQKEKEWLEIINAKDKQVHMLEKEKDEASKLITNLKERLKIADDFKQKLVEHQESNEQIGNFQTQELSKIKHLVLLRDKELNEKNATLKDVQLQLEKLRSEVARLRRQEEQLSDVQQNSNTEVSVVKKNLENAEKKLEKSEDEVGKLKHSVDSEHETNSSLKLMISKLEKELEEEKANSLNVQKTLTRVTSEKNAALVRNAEISQQIELVKQEKRRQDSELNELLNKINQLEDEHTKRKENAEIETKLRNNISDLEEQLMEKNKNIKTLTLRLADMKKTLQQELRTPGNQFSLDEYNSSAVSTPSQNSMKKIPYNSNKVDEDVNFKYLKHVIIKFLTSRDYEAQHLTKAVSTLLKFTPEEEKLISETLEWKKSWFGNRPKLFNNSKSKPMS